MGYNFEFLKKHDYYNDFAEACLEAEKSFQVSYASTAILTRRALELSVKWLYSYDNDLKVPYQEKLSTLLHDHTFRVVIESSLFSKLRYIQKLGNVAVHSNAKVEREEAVRALRNLYDFISWIDYSYSKEYTETQFDESLLQDGKQKRIAKNELITLYEELGANDPKLIDVVRDNAEVRMDFLSMRTVNHKKRKYTTRKELNEFKTRKMYIDLELKLAGWELDKNWMEEVEVQGMPSSSGQGFVDYVIYDDANRPLAVVEAKKTTVDPRRGKQQAKLYADCLEKKHGFRPIIFYTNGYDYYIWDDLQYPERKISGIYTKEDLEWLIFSRTNRKELKNLQIKDSVTNRDFQKLAIQSVCDTFTKKHRKTLLVMATGSGKTRTAISLVDVLQRKGWIKRVLFLADRKELVRQAKGAFSTLLPTLSVCNLLEDKENEDSRMYFSTYPTMMNAIDDTKTDSGDRFFTMGFFDLIIIDESHRSIYKKYQAIFDYFDASLVGLTATPKDEVDKNTYEVFELENGVPTFAYELDEAIDEGYLVDFHTVETKIKFFEEGIVYDNLSEDEQEEFEDTFEETTDRPKTEMNKIIFNVDSVDKVLHELMEKGIKVESNDKLGKTIIFAHNKEHASFIQKRFNVLYPSYRDGFMKEVYTGISYVYSIIDDFKEKEKSPQIAVSVDMLDTGIDVPEIVNLVFFKKVRSKSKFWQMVGRGTRTCEDLFGVGDHKKNFRIFDYCSNFEFFRENKKTKEARIPRSLAEKTFIVKSEIIKELQHIDYQTDEYIALRDRLIDEQINSANSLDETGFRCRMKIEYIHRYNNKETWNLLNDGNIIEIKDELAQLMIPIDNDELARRFDYMMYSIILAELMEVQSNSLKNKLYETACKLAELGTIPQVRDKRETIMMLMSNEFWENPTIFDYDSVRADIRDLIKFITSTETAIYYTNFEDEIIESEIREREFSINNFKNYRLKVNSYLRDHQDDLVVYKLRNNHKLSKHDIEHLEDILWNQLGTKEDYKETYGDEPLARMVSSIVGLEPSAVNEIFSKFLSDETLNGNQMEFVRMIVRHITKNGLIDKEILNDLPFSKYGSVAELFEENLSTIHEIVECIDNFNGRFEEEMVG